MSHESNRKMPVQLRLTHRGSVTTGVGFNSPEWSPVRQRVALARRSTCSSNVMQGLLQTMTTRSTIENAPARRLRRPETFLGTPDLQEKYTKISAKSTSLSDESGHHIENEDGSMIRRRRQYTDNFLIIDRRAIEDSRLSWKSRGLLAYLMSKPDHWQISVTHLCKEGDLKRDGIYNALKELRNYGYADYSRARDDAGKLGAAQYTIRDLPITPQPDLAEPSLADPRLVSTDSKKVIKSRGRAKRATRLPDDFCLTQKRKQYAKDQGVHPFLTFAKFTDHWKAESGARASKLDWDAAWRNWCRREAEFQKTDKPVQMDEDQKAQELAKMLGMIKSTSESDDEFKRRVFRMNDMRISKLAEGCWS